MKIQHIKKTDRTQEAVIARHKGITSVIQKPVIEINQYIITKTELGYKDWQEFKQQETATPQTSPAETKHKRSMRFNPWLLFPIACAVAVAIWLIAFRAQPLNKKPVIKGPVTFYGNKTVSQGVPNTIIFNYDVTHVHADSFFFQQSWNSLEKVKLDPHNHVYSQSASVFNNL